MTLDEALEGETVSREEALLEIKKHGIEQRDFFAECGNKPQYDSAKVLAWLGY